MICLWRSIKYNTKVNNNNKKKKTEQILNIQNKKLKLEIIFRKNQQRKEELDW